MTADQVSTPASRRLARLNVPHRQFRHPGPLHSLEQAAQERGQQPDQVVRSILFRTGREQYVLVLVAGARQVSWPALRKFLGQSRLTMASETEVLAVTGFQRGAVSPFGLPRPLRILVDKSVLEQQEISLGSGERGVAIIMQARDLPGSLTACEIGHFVEGDIL